MRRWVLTILALLVAGAVVNVAVAWGSATWSALKLVSRPLVDEPTEAEQRWWQQVLPAGAAPKATAVWRSSGFGCDSLLILGDRSGEAVFRDDASGQVTFNASVIAKMDRTTTVRSGWPWRSVAGERWDLGISLATPIPMLGHKVTTWRDADVETAAVSFDRPAWFGGSSFRLLPFRPIWSGFGVNTVFYAAILWLPFALRRLIRRRRGLCPACGYPMGESATCTECGKALPGRAEVAT